MIAEVDRRIGGAFRPEFLNRFDAICHFHPLGRVEIRKIAQREVGKVLEREGIRARGLDVEVAADVVDLLVERGYSPSFGARFLQREIEKTLSAALAVEIAPAASKPGHPRERRNPAGRQGRRARRGEALHRGHDGDSPCPRVAPPWCDAGSTARSSSTRPSN